MGLTMQPFLVLGTSIVTALLIEGLSWLLVYRTAAYKRLQGELERSSKKLESLKTVPGTTAAKKNKKETRLEEHMRSTSRELSATRMKTGMIMSVLLLIVYQFVNTSFDGVVVAKLPFVPPAFMRRITHNGLLGEDFTDCAAAFIYVAGSLGIRQNVQKLLGWAPSRSAAKLTAANPFGVDTSKFK